MPGYWQKPEETAKSLTPEGLKTGDVGFMDEDGWFFLVDRSKDMIVASGFKVWPREVEEALLEMLNVHDLFLAMQRMQPRPTITARINRDLLSWRITATT